MARPIAGAQQRVADEHQHHDRDPHRGQRAVGDRDRAEVAHVGVGDHDPLGVGADEELEGVLHRQRETDRDDHQLGQPQPAPSQWLPQDPVLEVAAEAADHHHQQAADDERQPGDVDQAVADHAAQGHLLGVGEVRDAGGAVDQAQPDAGQRQQQAEADAVDRRLEELLEGARGLVEVGGADRQGRGVGAAELDVVDLQLALRTGEGGVGRRPQLGALREGVRVDADEVVAGLGDGEAELAVLRGRLGLGGAVGLGEDDVDVRDRVGAAAHGACDAGLLVGLRQAQFDRVRCPAVEQQEERRHQHDQPEQRHRADGATSLKDAGSRQQWVLLPMAPGWMLPGSLGVVRVNCATPRAAGRRGDPTVT